MFQALSKHIKKELNLDEIAKLLNTNAEALKAFENAYQKQALNVETNPETDDVNAKQMAQHNAGISKETPEMQNIKDRIVEELISQTQIYKYDGKQNESMTLALPIKKQVTANEVNGLPLEIRPAFTGYLMRRDIKNDNYPILLYNYQQYLKAKNPKKKQMYYHIFRQGLDILDVDDIMNEILSMNPNTMGNWFPQLVTANHGHDFFKIPKTTVIKVPTTLLQLTRLDYLSLNRTTLDILDEYCNKVFDLKGDETYFIKNGVSSSKFDFRNAKVQSPKEVRELGEYLLFCHNQDCQLASPLNTPCIYGKGTTNEWVVRELIKDKENNSCIYKGLPLHTEYRVFVDFDTCEVLGINPYWDPKIMKQRFEEQRDSHDLHDYVIFENHKDKMMQRYNKNKDKVQAEIKNLLPDCNLTGQWSIDIMQNGDDFWLIDMATACTSALKECIPKEKQKTYPENWLPDLSGINELH